MREQVAAVVLLFGLAVGIGGCKDSKPKVTVQTKVGPMVITKSELTKTFPPGCTEIDPGCQGTKDGEPM